MTDATMDTTQVQRDITVAVPLERAFEVFTANMSAWWPGDKHIGTEPMETCVLEPRVGGRWYERGADGSECDWGQVLAWEPPNRVVLSWQIKPDWTFEPDANRASEVEVRFTSEGDNATRVEVDHRHIDRHGPGYEQMHAAVSSPGGWTDVLQQYAAEAQG